jgi:hypothetical protein
VSTTAARGTGEHARRAWHTSAKATWFLPVAVIASLAWLLTMPGHINADMSYAVVWGHDVISGRSPDVGTPYAPTPHPLATALGAVASLFGPDGSVAVLILISFLAFGLATVALFHLASRLFSVPVAAAAVALFLLSFPPWGVTVFGSADGVALAAVLVAVALEAGRPRRGLPVMALLVVSGLQRPESWLLSAAYWVYMFPALDWRRRLELAGLAAAAPFIWLIGDLAFSEQATHSLRKTQGAANYQAGGRTLLNTITRVADSLRTNLRLPGLIVALAGVAFALVTDWRRARLPLAVAALGVLALVGFGLTHLPILARFALEPAALLTVFFGVAAFGWRRLPEGAVRRAGAVLGLGAAVAVLGGTAVVQAGDVADLSREAELQGRLLDDFQALSDKPRARELLRRCPRIYLPHHRAKAFFAFELGRRLKVFRFGSSQAGLTPLQGAERPVGGLILNPADGAARSYLKRRVVLVPRGSRLVAANRSWDLYVTPGRC